MNGTGLNAAAEHRLQPVAQKRPAPGAREPRIGCFGVCEGLRERERPGRA